MDNLDSVKKTINNSNNFEEFHAITSRRRHAEIQSKKSLKNELNQKQMHVEGKNMYMDEEKIRTASVIQVMDSLEVQLFIILLIAFDLFAVLVDLSMFDSSVQALSNSTLLLLPSANSIDLCLQSFSGFTLCCFILEIGILIVSFRMQFFSHLGYTLDFGVVAGSFYWEMYKQSKVFRLFGIFRFWRIVRVVNSLLLKEEAKHEKTKSILTTTIKDLERRTVENATLEESLRREKESKIKTSQTLQAYKDEVETLKEALNIAATNVAEAAMQEYGYLTEDELASIADSNIDYQREFGLNEDSEFEDAREKM